MVNKIKWERFYTNSNKSENFVNQISIDVNNKRYFLEKDVTDLVTDGYDELGNEITSIYVSEFIFNLILKGIKDNDFVEYKPNKN